MGEKKQINNLVNGSIMGGYPVQIGVLSQSVESIVRQRNNVLDYVIGDGGIMMNQAEMDKWLSSNKDKKHIILVPGGLLDDLLRSHELKKKQIASAEETNKKYSTKKRKAAALKSWAKKRKNKK